MLGKLFRYAIGYNFPFKQSYKIPPPPQVNVMLEHNNLKRVMFNHMMDRDIHNGFHYAISSLLEAIAEPNEDSYQFMNDTLEFPLRKLFKQSLESIKESEDEIILISNQLTPRIDIHNIVFCLGLSEEDSLFTSDPYVNHSIANIRSYQKHGDQIFTRVDIVIRPKYQVGFKKMKYEDGGEHLITFKIKNDFEFANILRLIRSKDKQEEFRKIFFGQNNQWIIADIDQTVSKLTGIE